MNDVKRSQYRREAFTYRNYLRQVVGEHISALPIDLKMILRRKVKEKRHLSTYDFPTNDLSGHSLAVLRAKMDIICSMLNNVRGLRGAIWETDTSYNGVTASRLQQEFEASKNRFTYQAQQLRPSLRVHTNPELEHKPSKIRDIKGSGKNVIVAANVSPAWARLTDKLGGAIVQRKYLIVSARFISSPIEGANVYYGEVIDLVGDVKRMTGYFGIYGSGEGRIDFFSGDLAKTERNLRSRVARSVINEMSS